MPELAEVDLRSQFDAALTAEIYGMAWRYAWRLAAAGRGGCREEAEDLLQEALAQAWRQFGQLRDRSNFKAWLLAIIRTRQLDRLRRQRRRPQIDGPPPDDQAVSTSPEAETGIWAALRLLTAGEQELLTLFYCEGLSLAETGLALGLNARVVRQRLYRARTGLRRCWEQLYGRGQLPGGQCYDTQA
jgi:RNA polymerase sigma-70 factor (ECF subfamily)